MPTDKTEAAPALSARSKPPDPRIDTPKIHGDTGKPSALSKKWANSPTRLPAIIVGVVVAVVATLSMWYLLRPQPLLVQGEVDATRFDIAARVDGRRDPRPRHAW
jgi:HlyD family secretion protein